MRKGTKKRVGCLALALLTAIGLGVAGASLARGRRQGTTRHDAEAALAAEVARAESAGLVIVERGEVEEGRFVRRVPVAAGACVALVAVSVGPGTFQSTLTSTTPHASEWTRLDHRATCAVAPGEATVQLVQDRERGRQQYGATTLLYAILGGPFPADPDAYDRLALGREFGAAMIHVRVRRRAAALAGAEVLDGPRVVTTEAVALAPASRATHAARRALGGSAHHVARAALAPGDLADPFTSIDDEEGAAELYAAAGRMRFLAAVDAGALGAGCVRVVFAHLDDPREAIPVTRIALPALDERALAVSDPAIALDELCPAEGLFVYAVPANVTGDYALSIGSMPAPAGVTPRPSTYEPRPIVLPRVSALSERCAGGADAACIELAAFADEGAHGAGSVTDALDPACDRGGGEACAMLAAQLDPEVDARRIETLERRACATNHLPSCLRRAASLRARGRMTESLQTYRFACAQREASACAAVALFAEWELAPEVEVPTADALP